MAQAARQTQAARAASARPEPARWPARTPLGRALAALVAWAGAAATLALGWSAVVARGRRR